MYSTVFSDFFFTMYTTRVTLIFSRNWWQHPLCISEVAAWSSPPPMWPFGRFVWRGWGGGVHGKGVALRRVALWRERSGGGTCGSRWAMKRGPLVWLFDIGNCIYYPVIWVFPKNRGKTPKSSILIGFSIIFTIHFGGKPPIFRNIHMGIIS